MIPKIIHFIVPEMRSERQSEIIAIAERLHPDWEIKVWLDNEIPKGARLESWLSKARSGAQRADLIRLEVIYEYGGVYLDSDMRLHKPLDEIVENLNSLVVCSEDGFNLSNGFFAASPRHPAVDAIIAYLLRNEPNWDLPPNVTTGPQLFGTVLRYRDDIYVLPRETFYPYRSYEEIPSSFPPTTIAEHEWDGSWRGPSYKGPGASSLPLSWRIKRKIKKFIKDRKNFVHRIVGFAIPDHFSVMSRPTSYSEGGDVVVLTRFGIKMSLPASDLSVAPSLILKGTFEPSDEKFVASIVQGGDWVVDVGANVGLYSMIAAARCGPFGRVFAIEPNVNTSSYIKKSALLNWFHDRVRVINCAISDEESIVTMEGSSARLGEWKVMQQKEMDTSASRKTYEFCGEQSSFEVKSTSLDNLIPINIPIRLLKIDVEGVEDLVLSGAKRLISARAFQYVMIEISRETQGERLSILMKQIRRMIDVGYSPHVTNAEGHLVPLSKIDDIVPYLGYKNVIFKGW